MNSPPPTSRFFIGTLHQVQRRSGISAIVALCGSGLDEAASDMDAFWPTHHAFVNEGGQASRTPV